MKATSEAMRADTGAFEQSAVLTRDGVRLTTYATGSAHWPTLLFVNPLGLSVDLIAPLAALLGERYRFITWEARLSPGPHGNPLETNCDVSSYVEDIACVLDHFAIRCATGLLAWCSGCESALRFTHACPDRVASLVLISPLVRGCGVPSEFSRQNRAVYARVLRRPEIAADVARVLSPAAMDPEALKTKVRTQELEVAKQIMRPFTSADALLRQALAITQVYGDDSTPAIDPDLELQVPLLALSGLRDDVVDTEIAERLVRNQPRARIVRDSTGDHYMITGKTSAVAARIAEFLGALDRRA